MIVESWTNENHVKDDKSNSNDENHMRIAALGHFEFTSDNLFRLFFLNIIPLFVDMKLF